MEKDDNWEDDDKKAANGNSEGRKDQDNDRVANITVEVLDIIENVVDFEDACIFAKVITHSFKIFSVVSKVAGSISSHFLNVLSSSLGAPLPSLLGACLSNFLSSSRILLPSWFLLAISFPALFSSSILLSGPGCYFLPSISFRALFLADSSSLFAFFGFFSLPGSLDLLSTFANHPGKIFKILYWLFC